MLITLYLFLSDVVKNDDIKRDLCYAKIKNIEDKILI